MVSHGVRREHYFYICFAILYKLIRLTWNKINNNYIKIVIKKKGQISRKIANIVKSMRKTSPIFYAKYIYILPISQVPQTCYNMYR